MQQQDEPEIIGIYKFYSGDEFLGECKNALTTAGRTIAIKTLLGYGNRFADEMAFGIGNLANTFNSASTMIVDNTLQFEVARSPIFGSSTELDGSNNALIFYATIDDVNQYEIREIGLFPSSTISTSRSSEGLTLFDFDKNVFTEYGTASASSLEESGSARIGTQMYNLTPGNSTDNYVETRLDNNAFSFIDGYTSQDLFKLAMYNTTSSAASVSFRFITDDTNHYTITFISSSVNGYQILTKKKGEAIKVGTPDWNNVSSIKFWNPSASQVLLDGIKIDFGSYLIDNNFGMVSRAVLPTPIVKQSSVPVTVQYSLLMNFSGGL